MKKASSISAKRGLPPGASIYIGKERTFKPEITVFDFNSDSCDKLELSHADQSGEFKETPTSTWINVNGLHEPDLIEKIGKLYHLDTLVVEDILNTNHRPKAEEYADYVFVTLKMLRLDTRTNRIVSEQMSMVLGENWLLTFQEQPGDILDGLRTRLQIDGSLIRKKTCDFLMYRIMDTIIDHYFEITEILGDSTEMIEQQVLVEANDVVLRKIRRNKKQLLTLRKWVYPLRDVVAAISNSESSAIRPETKRHIKDVGDHVLHVVDFIETHREMMDTVMDLYLSGLNNKMNQSMKVLTVVSTIFIPPTFVAGVYGMNFGFMPELGFKFGYPMAVGVMISCSVGMVLYFKHKKFL